jgi:hypothetical protein
MRKRELAAMAAMAPAAAGCVTRTHEENAALRSAWPSVEGDILRGAWPEALANARAAVSQPLTAAPAKP